MVSRRSFFSWLSALAAVPVAASAVSSSDALSSRRKMALDALNNGRSDIFVGTDYATQPTSYLVVMSGSVSWSLDELAIAERWAAARGMPIVPFNRRI